MNALIRTVALAIAALFLLAGCGVGMQPEPEPIEEFANAATSNPATPVGLEVDAIDLHADSAVPLGVDSSGRVEVPPVDTPEQLGWYELGVHPGQVGPAIMLGHVNGHGRDGVFANIHHLTQGDEIEVPLSSGETATYVVDRVDTVPKGEFPTEDVYGDTNLPALRLITCGGDFNSAARSYEDQVIVYATMPMTETTE